MTVSVLDRWVRFDYPERALAGHLLNSKDKTCTDAQIPAVGIVDQHRGPEADLGFVLTRRAAFLGILLCNCAATNVAFVTN